ncbi:MAG: hypothetical protein AW07_01535 [Candidatus Accumulibacter sp. SK-11]|nr:MAG: hypothetical protein AW07_01535 [Candidatus Accumulibacter sp. SK-11]
MKFTLSTLLRVRKACRRLACAFSVHSAWGSRTPPALTENSSMSSGISRTTAPAGRRANPSARLAALTGSARNTTNDTQSQRLQGNTHPPESAGDRRRTAQRSPCICWGLCAAGGRAVNRRPPLRCMVTRRRSCRWLRPVAGKRAPAAAVQPAGAAASCRRNAPV